MSVISNFLNAVAETINHVGDTLGTSGYSKDKKVVREYAYSDLTREQYNTYKDEAKIHKKYNEKSYERNYAGFGIPMEISRGSMMTDVLKELADKNVVFEKGVSHKATKNYGPIDDMLQYNLERYALKCLANYYVWDKNLVCEPYISRLDSYKDELKEKFPESYKFN